MEAEAGRRHYRPGETATIQMLTGGVVTGTVTGVDGEPVTAIPVRAEPVELEGSAKGDTRRHAGKYAFTDDRGVYRVYGLPPGTYIVFAGGSSGYGSDAIALPHDGEAPTYYPSSTRKGATPVRVRAGEEVTNIDIRHRGVPGRSVRGVVRGPFLGAGAASVTVSLFRADGTRETAKWLARMGNERTFALAGIPDGEYDVVADAASEEGSAHAVRRIAVRGADVTGVELVLEMLSSIEGRVEISPKAPDGCEKPEPREVDEIVLEVARLEPRAGERPAGPGAGAWATDVPNTRGAFALKQLQAGAYALTVRLPAADMYVSAVARSTSSGEASEPVRELIVPRGRALSDLRVAVARGAASARGRVAPAVERQVLRPDLAVFFVPAEPEHAEAAWRYVEARVGRDGTFEAGNLAPGRYWLLARPRSEAGASPAWRPEERAALRKEAKAANHEVTLAACERVSGLELVDKSTPGRPAVKRNPISPASSMLP